MVPVDMTPSESSADRPIPSPLPEIEPLRQIFERAPVMLYQWVLSPEGEARFTAVSPGCEAIYGRTAAQLLIDIRFSMSVIHPEDIAAFEAQVAASAQELVPFFWEGRVELADRVRWLRAQSFPTRLPDGGTRWEGVILDITAERESERARQAGEVERELLLVRLQEQNQLLRRQAEALQELATPIMPLARGVIALPLIGNIDPARAQQLLEVLLEGAARQRAHLALVDITGVRSLDRFGAEALVRAAQALRMLGATMLLTGMRPATAQALVQLEVELTGLRVFGSFQEGVAFALGAEAGPRVGGDQARRTK